MQDFDILTSPWCSKQEDEEFFINTITQIGQVSFNSTQIGQVSVNTKQIGQVSSNIIQIGQVSFYIISNRKG